MIKKLLMILFLILVCAGSKALENESREKGQVLLSRVSKLYQLTGKWRFSSRDDLSYADPDYDDSTWRWASVPGVWTQMGIGFTEHAWYRYRFRFSEAFTAFPMGIQVPPIYDAHQVYINGILIGGAGKITPDGRIDKKSSRPGIYQIPSSILREDNWNVIALRIADDVGWGGITKSDFMIGRLAILELRFSKFIVWNSALVLILGFLGAFFLAAYAGNRREKSLLHFSLLSIVLSFMLTGYYSLSYLLIDSFWFFHFAVNTGVHLAIVFLLRFIYCFFRLPPDRFLRFFTISSVALFGGLLISPAHLSLMRFYAHWIYSTSLGIDALALLFIVMLMIKFVKEKRPQARIVGVGCLISFLCALNDMIGYIFALDNYQLLMEGIVIFMISMSFAMFIRYTRFDSPTG